MRVILKSILCAGLVAALPALAVEHQIGQKDRAFSQAEITIKLGEAIVFRNFDDVTHNVFSITPGMEFNIRRQAPGGASKVSFSQEGVAEVRCSIHPKMKLMVTVRK